MPKEIDDSDNALHEELRDLIATLGPYSHVESAMRLRALTEIAERLDTPALLGLAAETQP